MLGDFIQDPRRQSPGGAHASEIRVLINPNAVAGDLTFVVHGCPLDHKNP